MADSGTCIERSAWQRAWERTLPETCILITRLGFSVMTRFQSISSTAALWRRRLSMLCSAWMMSFSCMMFLPQVGQDVSMHWAFDSDFRDLIDVVVSCSHVRRTVKRSVFSPHGSRIGSRHTIVPRRLTRLMLSARSSLAVEMLRQSHLGALNDRYCVA